MKSLPPFLFILLSIIFQSLNGIFGKYAALLLQHVTLLAFITNLSYLLSLLCLVLQAIVWQQALIYFPLSFVYPFMSLTNFVVLFASSIIFHEGINPANVTGLILISIGITAFSYYAGRPS